MLSEIVEIDWFMVGREWRLLERVGHQLALRSDRRRQRLPSTTIVGFMFR